MTDTTEAAVLVETGKDLQLMELTLPELKPGQVLVDIAYSGVCHSQLNEINGTRGPDRFLPHTLGHEGSGTVVAVGDGVGKVAAGDRVVMSWFKGAGAVVPSTSYQADVGTVNSGAISTFMRRTVTCENRLTAIAADMPLREAALLGCAIATGAGMVMNTAQTKPGDNVAVFGLGGIGLSAVMAAKVNGAEKIIAVDVLADKLATAEKLGATHTIDASKIDPCEAIRDLTGGAGADVAIEAAGLQQTMEAAFGSVRYGGGLAILAGNVALGVGIKIDPFDLIRGRKIVGSWGGDTDPDRDFPRYADLYLDKKWDLGQLITHSYTLADTNRAMTDLAEGRVGRAMIDMTLAV